MLDYRSTSFDVKEARPSLAILPLAAIERHGAHLPVGTDWLIVEAIACAVAEALDGDVYLLPTMPFGTSVGHAGMPGTAWLSPGTLTQVVRDLVESLLAQGIRQVVVINDLGGAGESTAFPRGNFIVKTAVRQLNYDHQELRALWVQPFTVARDELKRLFPAAAEEVQAGALETSVLLHLDSTLVKGQGVDHVPDLSKEYLDYLPFAALCPGGVWGYPSKASAALGKAVFEVAVDATVRYIQQWFAILAGVKGPLEG